MSYFTEQASIIFKSQFSQKIRKLDIDILDAIGIDEKTTLTNNPIEGGKFNTDNARDEPTEITINGRISAFSIRNFSITRLSSLAVGKGLNRLKDAHDELYAIKAAKEPISLVTKYRTYDNMFLSGLNMPRDAGDGEEFRFTVTFSEVRFAESQLVSVANSSIKNDNAKKQSSFGRQVGATKTASPAIKPSQITFVQFIKTLF